MEMFDNPVFCSLAVFFALLFLLNLRSLLKIAPSLWDCVLRWKGNLDLEDSIQLSRSRNWVAAILLVPLCMVVYSFNIFDPDFVMELQGEFRLGAVTGVLLAYLLLRAYLNWQLEMHSYSSKTFTAANRSFLTYLIILFFLLFFTGALSRGLTGDPALSKTLCLWVLGGSYAVYVFRRGQIFASVCNPFTTFLYLCSLELLPTAALALSCKLL